MKKILLIGEKSYIALSFVDYCKTYDLNYSIDRISLKKNKPQDLILNNYDVVIYLAGIVHQKENKDILELYYKVNRDYPIQIAEKAKESGVSQFIYFSSMSVYGISDGEINYDTVMNPQNAYGLSKMQAEKKLKEKVSKDFNVSIIRPPMVYGYNSPGNYQKLSKLLKILRLYPHIQIKRSFIYIENLCEFLNIIVKKNVSGIFMPQNKEFVNIVDMVEKIGFFNNKKIRLSRALGYIMKKSNLSIFDKFTKDLTYSKEVSHLEWDYEVVNYYLSIKKSEGKN